MLYTREPGDPVGACRGAGREGKAEGRNPEMNADGKSYGRVVPEKQPNKAGVDPAAEAVEGRRPAKGNPHRGPVSRTQNRTASPDGIERVRQAARRSSQERFTALLHHVSMESLRAAFQRIRPQAAPGVDGVTKKHYGQSLESNLERLHGQVQRGAYKPKPARRVYITKEDGSRRPLAIGALEDKIVQGAVAEVLNAIYEVDFCGFSYGFRPARGAHDALTAVAVGIMERKVDWVLDLDLQKFFDSVDRAKLLELLSIRIGDQRMIRLIERWLEAGVIEGGELSRGERGTPQGAPISPLLANVYLHYTFDLWTARWRQSVARGDVIVVRYADDAVLGFQHRAEAETYLKELRHQLEAHSLVLHPTKTRLIEFGRFAAERRRRRGERKPETFTFLGLTHIMGKTRTGKPLLLRHTSKKRLRAKLKDLAGELRRRMHDPTPSQGAWLRQVLRGYFQYHAVPTNIDALRTFATQATRHWYRTLRRRSQKTTLTWSRMARLAKRWLPPPRILHPWPSLAALRQTCGRNPVR